MVNRIKYYVDFAIYRNLNFISFGAVIKNANGLFIFNLFGTYNGFCLSNLAKTFSSMETEEYIHTYIFNSVTISKLI